MEKMHFVLCPFIGPVSRGLEFFKLWITPDNCLVYGSAVLDLGIIQKLARQLTR